MTLSAKILVLVILAFGLNGCTSPVATSSSTNQGLTVFQTKSASPGVGGTISLIGAQGYSGTVLVGVRQFQINTITAADGWVPLRSVGDKMVFDCQANADYNAEFVFFIDGPNNTTLMGTAGGIDFQSNGDDQMSFFVTSADCGFFVNGKAQTSSVVWEPSSEVNMNYYPNYMTDGIIGTLESMGLTDLGDKLANAEKYGIGVALSTEEWMQLDFALWGGEKYIAKFVVNG